MRDHIWKIPVPIGLIWREQVNRYRLIVQRDGDRVRPIARNGYDWTRALPGGRKWARAFWNGKFYWFPVLWRGI